MRWLLLILLLAGCGDENTVDDTVTVGAASSLADVMSDIGAEYEQKTGARVQLVFASSGKIVQQQNAGAGYDAIVLADDRPSGTPVAGNTLVLVGADALADLPNLDRVAIGAPDVVPAGHYARQALQAAGIWDNLDGKIVYGANVRQVLAYAERGEVDAALVYATDANGVAIDASLHDPILYASEPYSRQGTAFTTFLVMREAQATFAEHGFTEAP